MHKKTKNWIAKTAIAVGSVAAIVVPVVSTVAYQSKTTSQAVLNANASEVTSTGVYAFPQNLPNHFDTSLEGFKAIYQTLERLYPETKFDYAKLESFYDTNQVKADNFIAYTNAKLMYRSFWTAIWNGIKGVGQAIATGVVSAANAISGGALDSTADSLENYMNDSFSKAHDEMNNVDWVSIGAWWMGLGTKALKAIEKGLMGEDSLSQLVEKAQINNILIPNIKEEIVKEAPGQIPQQFKDILDTLGINLGDILVVAEYSGSTAPNSVIPYTISAGSMADYLYGKYKFSVGVDFSKTSKVTSDQAQTFNQIANGLSQIIEVDIHS